MKVAEKLKEFRKDWEIPRFISSSWEKIQKELRSPSKPSWVLIILVIVNLIAMLLLGWEKFFSVFDSRWRFFFGIQAACFFVATVLVKKTKENKTAMNVVAWVIAGTVIAGFTLDHSGIRSWMKDGDVTEKTVPQATKEEMVSRDTIVAPVGKLSEWIPVPSGYRLFWENNKPVYVVIITTSGEEVRFQNRHDEALNLKVEAAKIAFSSLGDSPAEVKKYLVPK